MPIGFYAHIPFWTAWELVNHASPDFADRTKLGVSGATRIVFKNCVGRIRAAGTGVVDQQDLSKLPVIPGGVLSSLIPRALLIRSVLHPQCRVLNGCVWKGRCFSTVRRREMGAGGGQQGNTKSQGLAAIQQDTDFAGYP